MNTRRLFDELKQGIEEISAHKVGQMTLRTHQRENALRVDAHLIRQTREACQLSRAVFALKLRVSKRTLERWERGATVPNDQAAALILMIHRYPDTLKRLENI